MASRSNTGSTRLVFIDYLRVIAAFQMIQGHTLSALLSPELQRGAVHAVWSQARGLTSVAFLFAAGLSFHLAHASTDDDPVRARAARRRRARRALRLVGIGYALHLPLAYLWAEGPAGRATALASFLAVDVLQCIGVSLLVLEALAWTLGSRTRLALSSALLSIAFFAAMPLLARQPLDGPTWLVNYVSAEEGSLFPLVPWAAHLFLGVACAGLLRIPGRVPVSARMLAVGLALGVVALGLQAGSLRTLADHVGRLSQVALVCAALAALTRGRDRAPALIERFGRETLFLYVFHVLLVYASGVGLSGLVGPTLALGPALLVTLGVLGVTFGLSLVYRRVPGRLWSGRLARSAPAG